MRSHRFHGPILLLLLGLLLASCADEFAPCPDYRVGVVEGTVTVAGVPTPATVRAAGMDDDNRRNWVATTAGADGRYRLEVPHGRYRIYAIPPDVSVSTDRRDSTGVIEVGGIARRMDLALGRVRGTLRFPPGWDGQRIDIDLEGESWSYRGMTFEVADAELVYDLPAISPDRYVLTLDPRTSGWGGVDVPRNPAQLDSLEFAVGADVAVRDFDFTAVQATLSGAVLGPWRDAGADDPVVWIRDERARMLRLVDCDDDGAWTAALLMPQAVSVMVDVGNSSLFYGGGDSASPTLVDVGPGEEIGGLDVTAGGFVLALHGPGDVSDYGSPSIAVYDAAGTRVVQTHAFDLPVRILSLTSGSYRILVDADCGRDPWLSRWYGGDGTFAGAEPVVLETGQVLSLDCELFAGAVISGTIARSDGGVPSPRHVRLVALEEESFCSEAGIYTLQGRFDFQGVPDGVYRIGVQLDGWHDYWWYPGTSDEEEAGVLGVVGGQHLTDLDWTLPADPGSGP